MTATDTTAGAHRDRSRRTFSVRRGCKLGLWVGPGLVAAVVTACGSTDNTSSSSSSSGAGGGPPITVNIGALHGFTGAFSSYAQAYEGGLKLAVKQVNANGGFVVNGKHYQFKIVDADSQSTPAGTVAAFTSLVRDSGVKFMMGPDETPTISAALPQLGQNSVISFTGALLISNNLGTQGPTGQLAHVFALSPPLKTFVTLPFQAALKLHPNIKTAVVMWQDAASYDAQVAAAVSALQGLGIQVLGSPIRYAATTTDYSPFLSKVKQLNPDLIYGGASPGEITTITKQMVSLGINSEFVGTSGSASIAQSGAIGKPLPFPLLYQATQGIEPNSTDPNVQKFLSDWAALNGPPPAAAISYTSFNYTPLLMLVKAMEKAGTVDDVDKITTALTQVKVQSPAGPFSFNTNHQPLAPQGYCEVADGKVNCTTLQPTT